jgi:hypothetical protein
MAQLLQINKIKTEVATEKKKNMYFMIFDVVFQKEWIWTAPWNTVFGCCWK